VGTAADSHPKGRANSRSSPLSIQRLSLRVLLFGGAIAAALVVVHGVAGEVVSYNLGLCLIVYVAAIGLHILVNWTGDLSLAHAQIVGLSAISVGQLAISWKVSPIYLTPLGAAIGFATGALIGLPALRARGVQVAIITLAAGVAINRFLFTQSWLTLGFGTVPTPRLGPWTLDSSATLLPVCTAFAAAATILGWILFHSRTARAWYWIREDASGAAAYGIFVNGYRTFAYGVAGSFAGLAGALFAMWVRNFGSESFTSSQSFTYLLIVVIAGPGFLTGVLMSAGGFEAGTLFLSGGTVISYLGPVLLIFNVTRYPGGINGINREMVERYRTWAATRSMIKSAS